MILTPTQGIVAKDTHRFRVLDTGRRWGKTTLSVEEMKGFALGGAQKIVYVAPTYQQARDIVWETLKREMRPILVGKPNESRLEMTVHTTKGGTCQIMLRGWEAIETLRGQAINFIVLDEVAMYRNFWRIWQEVIRPTLTDFKGEAMFISTPKGFNHFYDLYNLQETDADYKSFQFTTYDNPHIPNEEIEKAKSELTEDRFAQEYMADFRKMEGLVYKEFDREVHVINKGEFEKTLPPFFKWQEFILGIDYGFTNPAAVLSIYRDSSDAFYLMDEFYKRGVTDPEVNNIAAALQPDKMFPDSQAASAIEDLKRKAPNKVREVVKGKDSIKNGIDRVRELFKANKLFIASNCINTIQELETYSYPDKKPDRNEYEDPIKENDHACFTGDTPISIFGGTKPIKDVQEGDLVRTPAGWSYVVSQKMTGIKKVVPFGENSSVTLDHPIATQRGFVRMDALRYDDSICVENKSLSTDSSSLGILARLLGRSGLIFSLAKRTLQAREKDFTSTSGKKNMVRFLEDFIFIIETGIRLTTNSQIWSVSPARNIINGIAIASLLSLKSACAKTSDLMLAQQLQGGTDHPKESFFIRNMGNKHGLNEAQLKEFVISAGESTIPISQPEADSVTTTARQKLCVREEEVYSLKTEAGMYFADGVLVSNCDALRYAIMMSVTTPVRGKAHQYVPNQPATSHRQQLAGTNPTTPDIPKTAHQYRPRSRG